MHRESKVAQKGSQQLTYRSSHGSDSKQSLKFEVTPNQSPRRLLMDCFVQESQVVPESRIFACDVEYFRRFPVPNFSDISLLDDARLKSNFSRVQDNQTPTSDLRAWLSPTKPSNLKSSLLRDNSGLTQSYPKAIPQIWSQANSEQTQSYPPNLKSGKLRANPEQTPSKPWVIPEQTPSKPKAIQKLSPKFEVKQTLSLKFEVTQCVHKNVMMIRFGVSLAGRTSPFWPCFRVLDRNLTHRRTSSYSQCT